MIKVKFVQGTMYAGVFYRKGDEARLDDDAAAALGDTVEKLGKVKEDKAEEPKKADSKPAAKVVKAPAADKMVKSPAKAKDTEEGAGNDESDQTPQE